MASAGGLACVLFAPNCLAQQSPSQAAGDAPRQAFNNSCRTCHTVNEGDNRLGPNLYKIIGRKAGSLPDYSYSSAMKDAGFVWDQDKLARFIINPDEVVSGNRMKPYTSLSSEEAGKIMTYLQSMAGQP
jgi:cytochrome c